MVFFQLFLYLTITVVLAFFYRTGFLYFSLFTGALPIFLIHEGWLSDDFGSSDINSIRVVGLWLAAFIVFLADFKSFLKYLFIFRFHLLFLVFCAISLFWTPNTIFGFRMIAKLSAPFLFLLMVMMIIKSSQQINQMERMIFMGGGLALLVAVMTWNFRIGGSSVGLTIPTLGPSLTSAFFMIVAMLALVKSKYEQKWPIFFFMLCLVAAVFASFTRITIVALFIGSSIILYMSVRGLFKIILPLSGILGIPLLFLFNETFRKRMFITDAKINIGNIINDPSILYQNLRGSGRFHAWDVVINHFVKPSPVIGSGIGATQNFFYSGSVGHMGVVHSEYVRLLADVGILGLFLFALAFLAYLFRLVGIYYRNKHVASGKYALAAVGGIIAYLIYLATDNGIDYVNAFGVYVVSLVGMSLKAKELEEGVAVETAKDHRMSFESIPEIDPDSLSVRRFPIIG